MDEVEEKANGWQAVRVLLEIKISNQFEAYSDIISLGTAAIWTGRSLGAKTFGGRNDLMLI